MLAYDHGKTDLDIPVILLSLGHLRVQREIVDLPLELGRIDASDTEFRSLSAAPGKVHREDVRFELLLFDEVDEPGDLLGSSASLPLSVNELYQ